MRYHRLPRLAEQRTGETGNTVLIQTINSPEDFGNFSTDLSAIDLCSIQFSPYGFSSNGISGPYLNSFANALSGKTHLVFHETDRGIPESENQRKSNGMETKTGDSEVCQTTESLWCIWYELSGHRSIEERRDSCGISIFVRQHPILSYTSRFPEIRFQGRIFWHCL